MTIREAPLIIAPILLALSLGLFTLSYMSDQSGDDLSMLVFFVFGLGVLLLANALAWLRITVITRHDNSSVVTEHRLFRRHTEQHDFGSDAQAELVVDDSDSDGNTYHAELAWGTGDARRSVTLDDQSSFRKPSVRIVEELNDWLSSQSGRPSP